MYTVYIIKSQVAGKSYVGMVSNLIARLREHNSGKGFYTKRHKPWKVIHKEEYKTRVEARKRERFLKSTSGRRELKRIFKRCGVV